MTPEESSLRVVSCPDKTCRGLEPPPGAVLPHSTSAIHFTSSLLYTQRCSRPTPNLTIHCRWIRNEPPELDEVLDCGESEGRSHYMPRLLVRIRASQRQVGAPIFTRFDQQGLMNVHEPAGEAVSTTGHKEAPNPVCPLVNMLSCLFISFFNPPDPVA